MNCPVCDRSLAPTLSICPTCGAMMRDTVREELQTKITPGGAPKLEAQSRPVVPASTPAPPAPRLKRVDTAGLVAPKTSPTLVEFQNKNAPLPDWRIQLQNAVQQRKGGQPAAAAVSPQLSVSVATAVQPASDASEPVPSAADPRVANALRRIEASQKAFNKPEIKPMKPKPAHSFGVVSPITAAAPARVSPPPKPQLVPPPLVQKRDTKKPLAIAQPEPETVVIAKPVIARVEKISDIAPRLDFPEAARIEIKAARSDEREMVAANDQADEIDDLAPFSMRFGAGLFDVIIGGFGSMLVLSPLAFSSTDWWTMAGLLIALGTLAVVSFFYMTACLGFFGKTMGMRLFSLELVDAVENEYPTLRQAVVNSFFFLLLLPLAGAGFLTVFFNEENRAVHDLLSGTIMVKEF
jgi:uncharacterized RDD family membrane protein YckC